MYERLKKNALSSKVDFQIGFESLFLSDNIIIIGNGWGKIQRSIRSYLEGLQVTNREKCYGIISNEPCFELI